MVTARVHHHTDDAATQPFTVELLVTLPGIDEADAQRIIRDAHQMCCYTRATRGNVEVKTSLN